MYYGKSYERYLKDVQARHPRAYTLWTVPDEEKLHFMVSTGCYSVGMIGRVLQRQDSAIICRLEKLGLPVPGQEKVTPKKLVKKFLAIKVMPNGDIVPINGVCSGGTRESMIAYALDNVTPGDAARLYLIEQNSGLFDDTIKIVEIAQRTGWALKGVI
ncbi:hypothetical protein LCGC14_1404940 [marine sediment metagenome]|uniref:Uncharacterized protein n=1 Tax=marine sediment metagenome TaxID=412755 RepID=A0A0F9KGX6_9ZZZZ